MSKKMIYTVQEAAQYLGVGKAKIYYLLSHNLIKHARIGLSYRIARRDLDDYLEAVTSPVSEVVTKVVPEVVPEPVPEVVTQVDVPAAPPPPKEDVRCIEYRLRAPETLIISRHPGAVEWLARRGIRGRVIHDRVKREDVEGKDVIGALPPYLACYANTYTLIEMPYLPPVWRDKNLNPEEMDESGARMVKYVTRRTSQYF